MGTHKTSQSPPVVFLHGAGQDGEIWAEVVPLVPRPVLVHEFPAHGGRFGAPLDRVEDLADDAIRCLPRARRSVLVGHSLGAGVALEATLRRPASVSGLVLVCYELDPKPDRRAMAALEDGDLDRFVELIHLGIVGLRPTTSSRRPPAAEAAEESARRLERLVLRTGLKATAADYRATRAHDLTGRIEGLSVPASVLAGGRDVLVPPRRVACLAAELGIEEEVIATASHQVPWEAPQAVADAVERVRSAALTQRSRL